MLNENEKRKERKIKEYQKTNEKRKHKKNDE